MKIVSIMAHQDDEMRCLGTMLKCRQRGDELFFLTLTDGSSGVLQEPPLPRKAAARIRIRELKNMARSAGGECLCLGERDAFLFDTPSVRMKLIEAIRKTEADVIFTHYHEDYNEDHMTTHRLVRHAAMLASLPLLPTASPALKSHPAIFCVEPHGPIPFPATYFVDITAFELKKIQLLRLHQSQEEAMQKAFDAGFDKLCNRPDAYWGEKSGCAFAEAFVPMATRGAIKPFPVLP
jgi:LmbE family N-acetylglucosaminyl deacetylase